MTPTVDQPAVEILDGEPAFSPIDVSMVSQPDGTIRITIDATGRDLEAAGALAGRVSELRQTIIRFFQRTKAEFRESETFKKFLESVGELAKSEKAAAMEFSGAATGLESLISISRFRQMTDRLSPKIKEHRVAAEGVLFDQLFETVRSSRTEINNQLTTARQKLVRDLLPNLVECQALITILKSMLESGPGGAARRLCTQYSKLDVAEE